MPLPVPADLDELTEADAEALAEVLRKMPEYKRCLFLGVLNWFCVECGKEAVFDNSRGCRVVTCRCHLDGLPDD